MLLFKKLSLLTAVLLLMLAGCSDGGSSGFSGGSDTVGQCIVGVSEVGNCKVFDEE